MDLQRKDILRFDIHNHVGIAPKLQDITKANTTFSTYGQYKQYQTKVGNFQKFQTEQGATSAQHLKCAQKIEKATYFNHIASDFVNAKTLTKYTKYPPIRARKSKQKSKAKHKQLKIKHAHSVNPHTHKQDKNKTRG
jgi:hypothetical protein